MVLQSSMLAAAPQGLPTKIVNSPLIENVSSIIFNLKKKVNTNLRQKLFQLIAKLSGLVWFWFLCLMAYQLFAGYLMPKPFS